MRQEKARVDQRKHPQHGVIPQCWKAAEGMAYSASPQAAWIHPPLPSMLGMKQRYCQETNLHFLTLFWRDYTDRILRFF